MNILFLGDIVGKDGRLAIKKFLEENKSEYDFIIANVENASHGFGLTEKNYNELGEMGINAMTSGNHIWDKKDIFNFVETADKLIRPINYPENTQGKGYRVIDANGYKVGIINILGRNFMPVIDSYLDLTLKAIEEIKNITPVIIIDFHAEATAEKICFAKYLSSFGISAFLGTHTHVQTADEQIINNQTAYITDAGFCGNRNGVIGMDYENSLKRILTLIPERFEVSNSGEACICGVKINIDEKTGIAKSIERIKIDIEI